MRLKVFMGPNKEEVKERANRFCKAIEEDGGVIFNMNLSYTEEVGYEMYVHYAI